MSRPDILRIQEIRALLNHATIRQVDQHPDYAGLLLTLDTGEMVELLVGCDGQISAQTPDNDKAKYLMEELDAKAPAAESSKPDSTVQPAS